jgi:hypothetical protein
MPTFFKCRACGKQHPSDFQFGSIEALAVVRMQGCKCSCPETQQLVPVDKEDLLFLDDVHFLVIPDDGGYSALGYEYNVAACGDTREEAVKNLAGGVNDYLRYLADQGQLDQATRPASAELLAGFLGLAPAPDRSEILAGAPSEGATREGGSEDYGLLESVGVADYHFAPPPSAREGSYYPVRVMVCGG